MAAEVSCAAGAVIFTHKAYTPQLVPSVKIQATRAKMLATGPVSRRVTDLPVYSNYGYRYWRQLPSGEVLVGGWGDTSLEAEETDDDEPAPEIQEHLDRTGRGVGAAGEGADWGGGQEGVTA